MLIAIAVFITLLIVNDLMSPGPMSYFEVSFLSSGGATLAIAAAGQTLVILSGGFDLSAGAVISLVNVVLSTYMQDTPSSILVWSIAGIGVGLLTGAFNGFFIAFLRLQPIVVTLSTMFIVQGLTLLVMDKPGGMIPAGLSSALVGDAIPGILPMPIVILGIHSAFVAVAEAHALRHGDLRDRQRHGGRARAGRQGRLGAVLRLCAGRWHLRLCRRLHQRADRARAIRWSAIRCCCRCSPPSSSAAPRLVAGAAARPARSSAPMC